MHFGRLPRKDRTTSLSTTEKTRDQRDLNKRNFIIRTVGISTLNHRTDKLRELFAIDINFVLMNQNAFILKNVARVDTTKSIPQTIYPWF